MKNLDQTAKQLFAKIRGRFPGVTIGDSDGNVTTNPEAARFFEFPFKEGDEDLGKISVSLEEENGVVIMYQKDVAENSLAKSKWYDFLKELRQFAKKRMLNFDTRDITKSNLEKRDYQYLAKRPEDSNMNESKMYGTSKLSYQNVDNARLVIKHTESINQEIPAGRTQKIGAIYVENADGERFKYPYKHLSGARAMARHVAEGGNPYDDFGKHITGLSEEMSKLRKFKTYMGRSAVMAESLSEYMDVVKDRVSTVKKTIESLQKPKFYAEAVEAFAPVVMEDVPADIAENWIDQLTIRQFNEELSDVFPYIYKLIGEATKATELGPDDLVDESALMAYAGKKKHGAEYMKKAAQAGREGASQEELGRLKDKYSKAAKTKEEIELEAAFETALGQFSDTVCEECGNQSWTTLEMSEEEIEEGERHGNSKIYDKCWKGYRKVPGKKAGEAGSCKKVESEEEVSEAYINTSKDAIEVLGALRGMGKKIERGQDDDQGNLANAYVGDVWDVYSFIEARTNGFSGLDKNAKAAIDAMMKLRGEAKKLETKPGSGKNARFGNAIVTTLYPVMEYLYTTDFDRNKKEDIGEKRWKQTSMSPDEAAAKYGKENVKVKKGGLRNGDDMVSVLTDDDTDEGNAYSGAVAQAKKDGKKKGDKIQGPDGDEITLEKDEQSPLSEFILSYYDRETGEFPKGETSILTKVEKDYGEQFIEPAKAFIEQINALYDQYQMETQPQHMEVDSEYNRMRELAGLR
jgi:hypothetical protein